MVTHEGLLPFAAGGSTAPTREPSATHRALARLRWFSLDGRLAAGEDPASSRLLAAQAARLTAPRRRELLASALGGLLIAAEEAPRVSRVIPSRSALLRNEAAVRSLQRRVDSRETLYARGLARLERLISDSSGPAYDGSPAALADELARVEDELSGHGAPAPLPPAGSGRRSVRRLARLRGGAGLAPVDPPGFAGASFTLPDGSWFHGRRDSA
jgi:hypothetical protein